VNKELLFAIQNYLFLPAANGSCPPPPPATTPTFPFSALPYKHNQNKTMTISRK
jgi:hypothetical protein